MLSRAAVWVIVAAPVVAALGACSSQDSPTTSKAEASLFKRLAGNLADRKPISTNGKSVPGTGDPNDPLAGQKSAAPKGEQIEFDTFVRLGDGAAARGNWLYASRFYERAARQRPKDIAVLEKLGFALVGAGRHPQAKLVFEHILGKRKQDADAYRGLGNALVSMGKVQEAIAAYRQAIQYSDTQPGDHRAYNGLGVALDMIGDHRDAQEAYRRGLSQEPANIALRNNLALSLAASGDFAGSVKLLEALAADRNASEQHRQNLAQMRALAARSGIRLDKRQPRAKRTLKKPVRRATVRKQPKKIAEPSPAMTAKKPDPTNTGPTNTDPSRAGPSQAETKKPPTEGEKADEIMRKISPNSGDPKKEKKGAEKPSRSALPAPPVVSQLAFAGAVGGLADHGRPDPSLGNRVRALRLVAEGDDDVRDPGADAIDTKADNEFLDRMKGHQRRKATARRSPTRLAPPQPNAQARTSARDLNRMAPGSGVTRRAAPARPAAAKPAVPKPPPSGNSRLDDADTADQDFLDVLEGKKRAPPVRRRAPVQRRATADPRSLTRIAPGAGDPSPAPTIKPSAKPVAPDPDSRDGYASDREFIDTLNNMKGRPAARRRTVARRTTRTRQRAPERFRLTARPSLRPPRTEPSAIAKLLPPGTDLERIAPGAGAAKADPFEFWREERE